MKKVILFFLLSFVSVKSVKSQLISLYRVKHTSTDKTLFFEELNIKLVKEDNLHSLKTISTDSVIFKPQTKCFFEVFDNKYIIATYIDTTLYKSGTSISPEFFPRKKAVIIELDKKRVPHNFFLVNFQSNIIHESIKFNFEELKKKISENDGYSHKEANENIDILKKQNNSTYVITKIAEKKIMLKNKKRKLTLRLIRI